MKKTLGNILFYAFIALLFVIAACQMGLLPFRFIYLFSGSMLPTFQPGDVAFVQMGNQPVVAGEVVLFQSPLGPTIHRVAAVENGLITTKGDANAEVDELQIRRVEGKVLFAIPKVGYAIDIFQAALQGVKNAFQGVKPG